MEMLKKILNWIMLFLGSKSELTDEMVDAGVVDFGGQGRDRYGN
jgi:hypothetical protein